MNLGIIVIHTAYIMLYVFVCFAFLDQRLAHVNLYYVLPVMYITYLLPKCPVEYAELAATGGNADERLAYRQSNPVFSIWGALSDKVGNKTFARPLSETGLLVFGGIMSAYALKRK